MYVYILKSINNPKKIYIGKTGNIKQRLNAHNNGLNYSTSKYKPWRIIWFAWFETEALASDFEKYLKGGSGFAFRRRHLILDH